MKGKLSWIFYTLMLLVFGTAIYQVLQWGRLQENVVHQGAAIAGQQKAG
ncbi:MAG: hypothetical protein WDO19_13370 [Bacteroidota bacterium]